MPAPLVDTHTHLGDPVFDPDRGEVLRRAAEAGVASIVVVTETLEEAQRNLELAAEHDQFHLAFGLYPTHLDLDQAEAFVDLIRERRDDLVAIGEVGLDRWVVKDEDGRALQREIFARFVDLSLELDLPLNVHSRAAGHYALDLLLERGARKVQMHAFDGKASKAKPGVEAGFYFSVPPSVVRSKQKQKLVRALPLECLLLETDSPVLGAERDERNEPARILTSLRAVAELKEEPEERVREVALANTVELYGENIL